MCEDTGMFNMEVGSAIVEVALWKRERENKCTEDRHNICICELITRDKLLNLPLYLAAISMARARSSPPKG